MAAAFRPVNTSLAKDAPAEDAMTSNPPSSSSSSHRPSTAPHPQYPQPAEESSTPTRATFAGTVAGQRPLPTSPFPQVPESAEDGLRRDGSQRSAKSPARTSMDVDMDESDGETGTVEENPGSDDESVNADGSKSGKKKKSQRFYCTDYPPCNLSFTRSEHLARHIRKHTGERPFQCHCSRRFSRLDNLRQHAQTVHVNEDIPIDSLAATGSRFQRQVRNDRVRQAGNRARASTGGSAGGPARGHSKSLSTPSISNIANLAAAASAPYNPQLDPRQRPTPIVMAADPRARLSFESNPGNPENPFSYRQQSPSEFASASGTFPTSQSSPSWRPDLTSPSSSHSRSHSMYSIGSRPASRRLSVPTGPNPFSYAQGPPTGRPPFGPGSISGPSVAAYPKPAASGQTPSPYMSSAEWDARRESSSGANDEAWRRRTWHSDSHGVNGPTVHHPTRPNHPLPIANPSMSSSTLRLPGIESFDPIPRPPASPPRQHLPPLAVDPQLSQRLTPIESAPADERRNLNMYDVSLQRGLNRLDIGRQTPPRELSWNEGSRASQAQPERAHAGAPTVRFEDQPRPSHHMSAPGQSGRPYHQYTMSAPNLVPSREGRRHGYYHGSVSGQQENGQQYAHEPRGPHLEKMVHPNFTGFAGFPARDQPPQHQQQERANGSDPLRRLEALVAVATSEGSTATAY